MGIEEKRKDLIRKLKLGSGSKDTEEDSEAEPNRSDYDKEREEIIELLKGGKIYYAFLSIILLLAYYIRTRNLNLLQGKYLLGLDPYAFFRYTREILQTGSMPVHDMMRYVPLGYTLRIDYGFLSYILAYSYKILNFFFPAVSQMEWHIIYPVVATIVSLIFFFLFVKKIFGIKIGVLSTAFLSVIPGYIYRTGAGFADHEAIAMLFMFVSLYVFALMWDSDAAWKPITFGVISGVLSAFMHFSWPGGYRFLVISIALFAIAATLLTKLSSQQAIGYLSWFSAFVVTSIIGLRGISFIYELENLLAVFSVLCVVLSSNKTVTQLIKNNTEKFGIKVPAEFVIVFGLAIVGAIIGWVVGILDFQSVLGRLLHPGGTNRFAFTVSENQQPYFIGGNGWWSSFSWTFLLAFFGSAYLIFRMFKSIKTSLLIGGSYIIFFIIFIFGRFSPKAKYASISAFSSSTYLVWFALFIIITAGLYLYYYKENREKFLKSFRVHWPLLLVFIWFIFTGIVARGAVRTIFAFAPPVAIVSAYFVVNMYSWLSKKGSTEKAIAVALILFAVFCLYVNTSRATQINQYSGSGLTGQWENAMGWINQNTEEDAVIAHWWDYGYWTQAVAKRGTVVDGGNAMAWDHGMGRYGLTHNNVSESFDYFKTHKVSHLLISEEEIGKYHAFATIGSDENFDRKSTIGIFKMKDNKEIRNGREYTYQGVWPLDQDLVFGMQVIPQGTALGGISVIRNGDDEFEAPKAYLFPNNQQIIVNIDCIVFNETRYEFDVEEPKMHACVVLLPSFQDQQSMDPVGTAFFESSKVCDGNLARLYNHGENIDGFEKVYDDGTPLGTYQGRIVGPIKIWEINYPESAESKDKYLKKSKYG